MRDRFVSGIPDLSRMTFSGKSMASLLKCRYICLMHSGTMNQSIQDALANLIQTYEQPREFLRQDGRSKTAVIWRGKTYTLEYDQMPVADFLRPLTTIHTHCDYVTTIKVPRSNVGSMLAAEAGFLGIIDESMFVAFTTNSPWPGSRIIWKEAVWRGRAFNAIRFSDNINLSEHLHIPRSICAQVITFLGPSVLKL